MLVVDLLANLLRPVEVTPSAELLAKAHLLSVHDRLMVHEVILVAIWRPACGMLRQEMTATMSASVTPQDVLDMLRQLPPHDRLHVIVTALPEVERELSDRHQPLDSLRGLWKPFGPAPSSADIDDARRDAWANFPHDDV